MRSTSTGFAFASCMALGFGAAVPALASDHDDTPLLKAVGRHDGRITDLYAFTRGDRLVLILCTNPAIPADVTQYVFPSDLTLRIAIDNHSEVRYDDPTAVATYGGTVVRPDKISEDVLFEVTFERGTPRLATHGLPGSTHSEIRFFTGLRDDPFIRGPRIGKNVAAVVIDLPLDAVLGSTPSLLVWASSKVPEIHGPMADLGGRALRSQFAENLALNDLPPRLHQSQLGVPPDVIIYDTSRAALFPNGRELFDDVVDMVGDPRILTTDAPFPSTNDVPFLSDFPYLPEPHLP
jgi:hypothetical protein